MNPLPALGQGEGEQEIVDASSPEPMTGTMPDDGSGGIDDTGDIGSVPFYQFALLIGLVILVLLYTAYENHSNRKLHLEAVDRLYQSSPPLVRQPAFSFASGVGDNILAALDTLANATTWTDLDDRAKERFAAYWKEAKERWQQLTLGDTSSSAVFTEEGDAQSDPEVSRLREIQDAQRTLIHNGWTLTPPEDYDAYSTKG